MHGSETWPMKVEQKFDTGREFPVRFSWTIAADS